MSLEILSAFDTVGGPLAGLTPTWSAYKAVDGGAAGAQPTIEEVGGGQYRIVELPSDRCGIIDLGAAASPRYLAVESSDGVTFAAFDLAGVPLSGLTPTWDSVRVAATGAVVSPEPTFVDLGGGLYRIDDLGSDECGVIDLGASANPQYLLVGLPTTDFTAPNVANVSPANGTTIGPGTSISLDVTDAFPGLLRVVLIAKFSAAWELIHDGDSFGPLYSRASTRSSITGGFRFVISRTGGWPSTPTILPLASDFAGNENA